MSLTSWPVRCPCKKCKGVKFQPLIYLTVGTWLCPDSGDVVVVNETQKGRAGRKHRAYIRR